MINVLGLLLWLAVAIAALLALAAAVVAVFYAAVYGLIKVIQHGL